MRDYDDDIYYIYTHLYSQTCKYGHGPHGAECE